MTTEKIVQSQPQKQPIVIILHKNQSIESVQNAIFKAYQTLKEKREQVEKIMVHIEGYEKTSLHPSQIRTAKKKYVQAIDWGLLGFMLSSGFIKDAQQVYCIAYVKAKPKGRDQIRFGKIDKKHMTIVARKSSEAYLNLLTKNGIRHPFEKNIA